MPQHIFTAPPTLPFTTQDRATLRSLAGQVAELAARPGEQIKRDLWYRHNALEATRPLIFCDPENGWHEIITHDDLTCETDLARQWEFHLRREIFWGAHMQDDRVITPTFDVPHVWQTTGWGVELTRIGGADGGAYTWDAPIKQYADMDRLRVPTIQIDYEQTAEHLALADEIFGDLLTVQLRTRWYWSMGMTWTLAEMRGLQQIMLDMLDCPDDLHQLMAFLRDAHLAQLDFWEANNLLYLNNDDAYVGSGGFGWTHELPGPDFDGQVRCQHLWGFAESQETVGISPKMFAEFVLPYQLPLLERFGLNCYGCCEPLDLRWSYIKDIPRLRRVSVSPWADRAVMAEYLGNNYIYSMKPHPNMVATSSFTADEIRATLRYDMQVTRDCRVEVILKDTHTIQRNPQRVIDWVRIAREEAESL